MKRIASFVLCILMVICFAACEGMDSIPMPGKTQTITNNQSDGIKKEDLNGYWESEFDISDIMNDTLTRSIGKLVFNTEIGIDLGLELDIDPIDLYMHFENDGVKLLIVKDQYTEVIKGAYISMLDSLKASGTIYERFLPEGINWEEKIDSIADFIYSTDLSELTMLFNDYTEEGIFLVLNSDSVLTYDIKDEIITIKSAEGESFDMTLKRGELKLTDDEANIPVFKALLDITTTAEGISDSIDEEISDLEFEKIGLDVLEAKYGAAQ